MQVAAGIRNDDQQLGIASDEITRSRQGRHVKQFSNKCWTTLHCLTRLSTVSDPQCLFDSNNLLKMLLRTTVSGGKTIDNPVHAAHEGVFG